MNEMEKNVEEIKTRRNKKKRVPLGVVRYSLSVPDEMLDPDYHFHFFNDNKHKPTRLQDALNGGYTFVEDKTLDEAIGGGDGKGMDQRVSRFAGTNEDGSPYRCYLMKIKNAWYEEDQAAKQAPLDQLEKELNQGSDEHGTPGEDTRYIPREGIKIERTKEEH